MNKLYKLKGYSRRASWLKNYNNTFILSIHIGYDFNAIIDDEGNTILMASLIANDIATALYIIYIIKESHRSIMKIFNKLIMIHYWKNFIKKWNNLW